MVRQLGIWQIILISSGLSLDVFAYCLYRGAMVSELNKGGLAKMCGIFVVYQMGALALGRLITMIPVIERSYQTARVLWRFVAAVMFLGLGIYMIIKAVRRSRTLKIVEKKQDRYILRVLVMWALITSVDALIAGMGFGVLGIGFLVSFIVIGIVTFLNVIIGFFAGYMLGCGPMNKMVMIGGCLVLIGGVDVFISFMHML